MKPLPKVSYEPVVHEDKRLLLLLAGDVGSGKTTAAMSAQSHSDLADVLFINIEDGIERVHLIGGAKKSDAPTPLHTRAVVTDLLKPVNEQPENLRSVKTIVVDSVTKLRDKTLHMLASDAALKGNRPEDYIQEIQDYGRGTTFITNLVDQIMQTGKNVILIAGVDEEWKNGVKGQTVPLLNPKLSKMLGHMMHFVWYAKENDGKYAIRVLPGGGYKVKTSNPYFVRNLREVTKEGWYMVPDFDFPTIPTLYDLYLNSKPE